MSKILIVDDEKDVLDLAQEMLEAEGFTVLSTQDGEKHMNSFPLSNQTLYF